MRRPSLFVLFALALRLSAATSVFTLPKTIRQDLGRVVLTGDVNHDGRTDIVTFQEPSKLVVFLANTTGDFLPPVPTTLPASYSGGAAFCIGDVNGDGNLDVGLRGDSVGPTVMVGNGDGSFSLGATLSSSVRPGGLAFGDFTGDGRVDLIAGPNATNGGPFSLFVYPGNGSGGFGSPIATANGYGTVQRIVPADLDHDGKLDLMISEGTQSPKVWTLKGVGDGTFTAKSQVALPAGEFALADLDGDGNLDAVANGTILLGNGDRSFRAGSTFPTPATGGVARTADLNGDGKTDVVVLSNSQIGILLGQGNGTFDPARWYSGNSAETFHLADFDGNGTIDVLDNSYELSPGNGDGTLRVPRAFPLAAPATLVAYKTMVAAGDMTGDGKVDALAVTTTPGTSTYAAVVFPGLGDGTFAAPIINPISELGGTWAGGDFNADGQLDFVVFGFAKFFIYLSNHDGSFHVVSSGNAYEGTDLGVRDYDGDGDLDLITTTGARLDLHRNNGDGSFSAPIASSVNTSLGLRVIAGDLNGDGKLDLVDSFETYFGSAAGTFTPVGHPAGFHGNPVAMGDFDGDHKVDVVFDRFVIAHGNGDGTFRSWTSFDAYALAPSEAEAIDVDGDGNLDLVSGSAIFFGDGQGGFANYEAYRRYVSGGFTVADLDGNGSLDILGVTNGVLGTLLTRTGNVPPLHPQYTFDVTPNPASFGGPIRSAATATSPSIFDPSGVMRMDVGGRAVGMCNVGPGTETFPASALLETLGTVPVTGTYLTNNVFGQVSITKQLPVNKGTTSVSLSGSSAPIQYPNRVALSINFHAVHGAVAPTGTITLREGANVIDTWPVTEASIYREILAPSIGTHTYTAEYSGDPNFLACSMSLDQVITKPYAYFSVTVSPESPAPGGSATVRVQMSSSNPNATGTMTFRLDGVLLGTAGLSGGVATFGLSSLPAGVHELVSTYSGDANYLGRDHSRTLVVYLPFGTPSLTATAGTGYVYIQWPPMTNATAYDLYRSTSGGPFTLVTSTSSTSYTQSATAWTMYLYRLVARDANGNSTPPSAPDPAMITTFADDSLVAAGTLVKAQHLLELRTAVNLLRQAAGLPAFSFTTAPAAGAVVNPAPLLELRAAVKAARDALGIATTFGTAPAAGTLIRATHIDELRLQVK